jgi:hypothetical protein
MLVKTVIRQQINGQVRKNKYASKILSYKTKILPVSMYRFRTKEDSKQSKWRFLDWQYEC